MRTKNLALMASYVRSIRNRTVWGLIAVIGISILTFSAAAASAASPSFFESFTSLFNTTSNVSAAADDTRPAGAPANIVVTPADLQGWVSSTTAGGAIDFVFDATAPAGRGALRMTTDATNTARANFSHAAPSGTLLTSVTDLSYYTKQVSGPPVAAPSFQLPIYLCGGTTGFTTLVYEPYQKNGTGPNPPIVPGVFEFQDVDQGMFYSSRSVTCPADPGSPSVVAGAGGPPFYSLSFIQTTFPNAVVIGYGVQVGTFNQSYNVETDLFNFNGTVYDFEPGNATVVVDDDGLASATDCDATDVAQLTIQAAVNAANPGDTVKVCPGTYNEAQILIQKSIAVVGSGSENTIIDGGGAALASAGLVRIDLPLTETGDASFSGFTVRGPGLTGSSRYLIFAKQVSPDPTITIANNRFQGVNLADYGLYTDRPRGPIVVNNNEFLNNAFNPILIERPQSSTDVFSNTISGNFATGYFNFTYDGNNVAGQQRVANNTFNSPNTGAISFSAGFQGSTGGYSNVSITDNMITALGATRTGISLSNGSIAASQTMGTIENAVVSGNRISGIDGATSNGIRLRGTVVNASINGNNLSDLARGLWSEILNTGSSTGLLVQNNRFNSNATGFQADGAVVSNVTCNNFTANSIGVLVSATAVGGININQNNIFGNTTFGVQNLSATSANAENNYWGAANGPGPVGPGSGDLVSTNVDFDPFLTAPSACSPDLPRDCTTSTAPYELADDFSLASNPNCEYTYGNTTTSDPSSPLLTFPFASANEPVAGIDRWHRDEPDADLVPAVFANRTNTTITYGTIVQDPLELNLHPGPLGERAVVRFTAPVAGNYTINGQFEGIDTGGTTTDVRVIQRSAMPVLNAPEGLVDGIELFSGNVDGFGDVEPFNTAAVTLAAGDIIDFSVGYGANASYNSDSTGLTAVIGFASSATPTPTPTPTATPTPTPTPTVTPTPTPTVRTAFINDVLKGEGNSGTTEFVFDVNISSRPALGQSIIIGYTTIDGTAAVANNDYQATSGTLTFTRRTDTVQKITVLVNGDTAFEPDETFTVRLTYVSGDDAMIITKGNGIGTIFNDDVSGSPTPTPANTPTPTPTPTATPSPTATPVATPTPFSALEGDVVDADGGPNGDGRVLANDISVIRQFVLGTLTPVNASQFQRADVNGTCGDGMINAADVTIVRQFILGALVPTTACGPTGPSTTPTPTPTPTPSSVAGIQSDPVGQAVGRIIRSTNANGVAGQTVVVTIQLDSQGDEASASYTVNFDPTVLSNPVVTLGSGVPSGSVVNTNLNQVAAGRVGILVDSTNTYAVGTRQMVTITFNVAANAANGTYPITFSSSPTVQSVSNAQGVLLATTFEVGNVIIGGTTAADVTVTGRVTTSAGQGIRGVTVAMTDSEGVRRTALTSSFGVYTFEGVESGRTYIVNAASRRYRFASRVLNVNDSLANVDFIGQE